MKFTDTRPATKFEVFLYILLTICKSYTKTINFFWCHLTFKTTETECTVNLYIKTVVICYQLINDKNEKSISYYCKHKRHGILERKRAEKPKQRWIRRSRQRYRRLIANPNFNRFNEPAYVIPAP